MVPAGKGCTGGNIPQIPGEWSLFAVDRVETPASSRLVPDSRERLVSVTDSWSYTRSSRVGRNQLAADI